MTAADIHNRAAGLNLGRPVWPPKSNADRARLAHLVETHARLAARHFWRRCTGIGFCPIACRHEQAVSAAHSRAALEYRLMLLESSPTRAEAEKGDG